MPLIRRQYLSPEQLAQELKRVEDGVLIRLPVAEFDERVKRAAQASKRKVPPQLLEARYHAVLKEESLVGDAQWKVLHAGPDPGLLGLESFNLALRQARFENGDALIAAFDEKTPALLVETAGEQMVALEWSARAEADPEGLRFHLEIPPCAVAVVELDVPAGRDLIVLDDTLLSGPHAADTADQRRWRIVCGGRRALDFRIRPADRPSPAGNHLDSLFVQQKTTQKLYPEGLDATYELRVESLQRGVRELVCECDPELRLRDVVGPSVDRCTLQPGSGAAPSRLTIRLRELVRKGTWQILCLAPLSTSPLPAGASSHITWKSPGLRLVGGVPWGGETLDLFFHPDLRFESWDAGGFRLTDSKDVERQTGMRHLTLAGGGLVSQGAPANAPPIRPQARLQAYGVEYRAHQLAWWRCDAGGVALTLQIGYDVSQGQLFQLPVLLPAGWVVERVEMNPSSLLRQSHERTVKGQTTLYVELKRPLVSAEEARREDRLRPRPLTAPEHASEATAHPAAAARARVPTLTIHLRPARPGLHVGRTEMPLPNAVPLGAHFPEGGLALDCDPQLFHLDVRTSADRSETEKEGPWSQPPEYYYRYRGQPVTGTLIVEPRPPRLRARCHSEVLVASGQAVVETRLVLEAEVGSPQTIDLAMSASDGGPWTWRTESGARRDEAGGNGLPRIERLHAVEVADALQGLAARDALAAAVYAARPSGERWRLTLARPLRPKEPLRLRATRQLRSRNDRWRVPLPVVLNAGRMEGEVTLHLAGADLVHVETVGLREAVSPPGTGMTPWRTFRYGQADVALTLSGQALDDDRAPREMIDRAHLVTYVGGVGLLRHHFSFQVSNWKGHTLPLRLPAGSRPLAVQVDGRWLPRLVSAETAGEDAVHSSLDPQELALPVPGRGEGVGDAPHRFEIVYSRPAAVWFPWQTVEAPAPVLPVPPLAFRRSWRLARGLVPLREESFVPIPGTTGDFEPSVLPQRASRLFHLPRELSHLDPFLEDMQASAREALVQAVEGLRGSRAGQTMSLREVVREMAVHQLKDRYPLVVDTLALRRSGVSPDRPLSIKRLSAEDTAPPWTACGLTAVPVGSAIVLTSTSGWGGSIREPFAPSLEQAVAAAVSRGLDPSGRFVSALHWLRPESPAAATSGRTASPGPVPEAADWSEWESAAGLADDRLIVVRSDQIAGIGLAATIGVMLLFWVIRRRSVRTRLSWLFLALALFGLGTLWLPAALRDLAWWPLLACGFGALVWYLKALVHRTERSSARIPKSRNAAAAVVTASLVLIVLAGWSGRAAAPAPFTVYLVPGPAEAPENQTVLAPADLLDRLKALARPASLVPGGSPAVLLDARYEGKLVEGQADFKAFFSAQCLTDEPVALAVPLGGVQLTGNVRVDGTPTDALALPAPQDGFSIRLHGRGRHKIQMRFRTSVAGTPEDRNVLFTVPPLLGSHLTWHVPPGASFTQALARRGAEWTARDGGERLEVDLGRLQTPLQPQAALHLHWHQGPQSARIGRVQYRAAYLWDLHLEGSLLTAWLRYRISDGAVKTLLVDLPADLEVRSADARRSASAEPAPAWLPLFHLRDWHVQTTGGKRVLHLDLPFPLSGDIQVMIELVPRAPLPTFVTLPLPAPQGTREAGQQHYLAYRTHAGLEAQRGNSQNITRVREDEFAHDWPDVPRLKAGESEVAFKFGPERPPILPLRLTRQPPIVQAQVELLVQTGTQLADIQATVKLETPNHDVRVVECDLQSSRWTVAAVSGEDVRSWKQTGPRLLIWLHPTAEATRLTLSGWLSLEQRDAHARLDVPCLRVVSAREQQTRLRLAAASGLTLASVKPQNMQPVLSAPPVAGAAEYERTFETRQLSYGLRCEIQAAANAVARVLTIAEVVDRKLQFTSTIEYEIKHGELRRVQLRLRNWEGEKVELRADHIALQQPLRRTPGDHSWRLGLEPGVRRRYVVTLHGSMPVEDAAAGIQLPDVSVQGAQRTEYLVAVAGDELTGEARGSLARLADPAKALARWPGLAESIQRTRAQGWRVEGPEWQLLLLPQSRPLEATAVRLFLMEQSAAVVDGRSWLHEARCWLRHEAHTDLTIDFVAPVRVVAAAVDGVEVPPLQPGPSRLWLPLPGVAGVRCVRLRWQYRQAEPLDHPQLTPPHVVDAQQDSVLWTVMVPPGWEVAKSTSASRLGTGAAREGALALYRAEAQLRISHELCKQGREAAAPLAAAQRRFAQYCRHARHALDLGANRGGVRGPAGQSLEEWLRKLTSDNRALIERSGLEPVRTDAERQIDAGETLDVNGASDEESVTRFNGLGAAGSLDQRGTPISWQSLPGAPPELELTSHQSQQIRVALASSGEWLAILVFLWVLSFLPFLLFRLRLFWPEQIAVIALLGWHLAGLTLVVLALLLVAVGGRMIWLARGMRTLFRKPRHTPSTMTPSGPAGS